MTSPLNNVVIVEGDVEAEADRGGDDINLEGDDNYLEQGEKEKTLTDGTMDTGRDAGADDGSVDNMDEIGEEKMLTDGAMNTNGDGEDNNNDCKPAAKPTVVEDGRKEGVEETCTALPLKKKSCFTNFKIFWRTR